jgi:hypothetical protein
VIGIVDSPPVTSKQTPKGLPLALAALAAAAVALAVFKRMKQRCDAGCESCAPNHRFAAALS